LNSLYQHAYKKGHSTTTALVQMTDEWLHEIDDRKLVGTEMLDLSPAFDLIDYDLLLKKNKTKQFIMDLKSMQSNGSILLLI